jgi:hypothetical protein
MSETRQLLPDICVPPVHPSVPPAAVPDWVSPTLVSLARLGEFRKDWDGYGSPPIRPAALQAAHYLVAALLPLPLPIPSVCPITGGGIGFTWLVADRELNIEILPDGLAQYLAVATDPATGQEITREEPLPLDRPECGQALAEWLRGG